MKFSEHWLRQHVNTDADRDTLAATLTAIGLEVEGIEVLGEGLAQVVVGELIACAPHPQADRLQVCQVAAGLDAPLQIVCGAPNARAGLKAPLALIGAVVGGTTIKQAELRGVASHGMLCSARELGLDADASGLLELPADAPVGAPLAGYLGLPDASIELKLTPNRADCFSLRGIAHDVAAALDSSVVPWQIAPVPAASEQTLAIELHAGADAPRYCGRVLEGVNAAAPTPVWMAERLRRSGVRPLSLLVDVTQYVMLELGQPMHAFDRATLAGPIGVRHARAGETLQLLDGRDVALDAEFLVITDADSAVALAGLMGGMATRVTDATTTVFLEAAHFAPSAIIGRSRRLGLHTDAAHRFERGVDPELPAIAVEYATRLILDHAGGTAGPLCVAEHAGEIPQPRMLRLRGARLARVLGMRVDDAEVVRILGALGMQADADADGWQVQVPTRRFDVAIEEDLIEEVARIHGYDRVPARLPQGATAAPQADEGRVGEPMLGAALRARDARQAICFPFVDEALLQTWGLAADAMPLANPLSRELAVMRPSLLPGLVQALLRNLERQQARVRLYETGRVFHAPVAAGDAPRETMRIAFAVTGARHAEQWATSRDAVDFADLKGDLESLAALSGARLSWRPSAPQWAHPGRSADVWREDGAAPARLGWAGELHPRMSAALGLDRPVLAFEVDLALLAQRPLVLAQALSRYPGVRRDLAIVVAEAVPWSEIEACARDAAGPLLRTLWPFDLYQGPSIGAGRKSIAMGLILQDDSRTLTDRDVDAVTGAVTAALTGRLQARLRDQ